MISIVDYGLANLHSVGKAVEFLGSEFRIIDSPEQISSAEKIILPGVGSFGKAMSNLEKKGIDEALRAFAETGRPFLGICLGMQLLLESSQESRGVRGLGVIKGEIKRFNDACFPVVEKIPNINWMNVDLSENGNREKSCFSRIAKDDFFYFVHSYVAAPEDPGNVLATAKYGEARFVAAIGDSNVVGTQFHPEKSGEAGLKILDDFLKSD